MMVDAFRCAGLAGILLALSSGITCAETYPTRPVTISVGYSAGAGMDVAARFFAAKLSKASGQQFIVVNRPGAGGNLAAQEVAQAKPDGYQLLWGPTATFAANPSLFKQLPYDPRTSYTLVSTVVEYGFLLVTGPQTPASTIPALKALLAGKPKATYGGLGSTTVAIAERFKSMAGIKAAHVTYKAMQEVVRDVSAADVDFAMVDVPFAMQQAKNGKLKIFGVTLPHRMAAAPDIPTLSEAGVPGFEATGWMALAAPAGTPADVVAQVRGWIIAALGEPDTKTFLRENYYEPFTLDPAKTDQFLKDQIEKWRELITAAGIEPI
ncbi:MAG: transporter substrate-binding protein [Rhizobium sp.]|jgi:tripartite-type tricarboxylate transporter receptor subunit TctC|nr:transporter substrate-binding protein [Rhizobium sp.]